MNRQVLLSKLRATDAPDARCVAVYRDADMRVFGVCRLHDNFEGRTYYRADVSGCDDFLTDKTLRGLARQIKNWSPAP